jgi:hypothetical protein
MSHLSLGQTIYNESWARGSFNPPMQLTVEARDGSIELPEDVWERIPVLQMCIEDTGRDNAPLPVPVGVGTLEWVKGIVNALGAESVPKEWTDMDDIREAGVSELMWAQMRLLRLEDTLPILRDLNFLGGGYLYSCLTLYVAEVIRECKGDATALQRHFKLYCGK